MLWMISGCASMLGLTELDSLPADHPLTIETEVGHITSMGDTQVAVDLVYPTENGAREGWKALRAQALSRGFQASATGVRDKRDFETFSGPKGKLDLTCCAKRADKKWLVFVTWWKPENQGR